MRSKLRFKALIWSLILVSLAACQPSAPPSAFKSTDITGAPFGRDFHLTDHHNRARRLEDFKGKVVLLFFGYTHCPDVCPTTLSEFAAALQKIGPLANKVQVLFVTLDPERDTPALLAQYVPAFNPSFLGLYGSAAQTQAVAQEFKIVYQKNAPEDAKSSYTLDHSAGSFAFDPHGRLRLLIPYGQDSSAIAHDLQVLLRET